MTRLVLVIKRRGFAALLAAILAIALVSAGFVRAQTTHAIKLGDVVNGTLSVQDFAQVYSFSGGAGTAISITATSQTRGLTVGLLLTNAGGDTLARAADLTKTAATITGFSLPSDGTYYITVIRGTGAQAGVVGNYTLALTGGTAPASTVAITDTLSVSLSWNTRDDLNLEVRDPLGGAVNFRTPSVPSGGRLSGNVNANCTNTTNDNPTETVSWPRGNVPGGSYEVIVYFVQACPQTASAGSQQALAKQAQATQEATDAATLSPDLQTAIPSVAGTEAAATQAAPAVTATTAAPTATNAAPSSASGNFQVAITVNGKVQSPVITGTLNPNQQYVASFILGSGNSVKVNPGGPNLAIDLTPAANKIASPAALGNRTSVNGTIDRNNPIDAWAFTVAQNSSPVTISMNASSGSLDPFLVLLGPDGSIISSNDDANADTRNSQISNQALAAGNYTIIATRFALQIGGTEGNYTLLIGNQATTTTAPTATLGTAAITSSAGATAVTTSGTSTSLPTGSIQVSLTWNTVADMRLLIRDPSGQSVFSDNRTPDNSGILDVLGNFKCLNTVSNPQTYAYWPNGLLPAGTYEVGVWLQSRCTDTQLPRYNLTVSVKGKKIIDVTDSPEPNGKHFLTTFTVDASGNATQGPAGIVTNTFDSSKITADLLTNAPVLASGTPATGTLNATTPFVLYTFTGKANNKIDITLKQASGNLDPLLFLLDSNGNALASNDDVTPGKDANSEIKFTLKVDGTYVVVATRYGIDLGGTSGTYQLALAGATQ